MVRVGIAEASEQLGISVEGVRKRIKRGTLLAEMIDGEWAIELPSPDEAQQEGGQGLETGVGPVWDDVRAIFTENIELKTENARLSALLESERRVVELLNQRLDELSGQLEEYVEGRRRSDSIIMAQAQALQRPLIMSEAPEVTPWQRQEAATQEEEAPKEEPPKRPWWRFRIRN